MDEIMIEWRRLVKDGDTCLRCSETGALLPEVIERMADEFAPHGVRLTYRETELAEDRIEESNVVLFDGVPIEELVGASVVETDCPSCADLLGERSVCCRAIRHDGRTYEALPESLLWEAAFEAMRRRRREAEQAGG